MPREGFEPTRPFEHYALNVARLPFRHLGFLWLVGGLPIRIGMTFPMPSGRSATSERVVGGTGLEPVTSRM